MVLTRSIAFVLQADLSMISVPSIYHPIVRTLFKEVFKLFNAINIEELSTIRVYSNITASEDLSQTEGTFERCAWTILSMSVHDNDTFSYIDYISSFNTTFSQMATRYDRNCLNTMTRLNDEENDILDVKRYLLQVFMNTKHLLVNDVLFEYDAICLIEVCYLLGHQLSTIGNKQGLRDDDKTAYVAPTLVRFPYRK